MPVYRLPEEHAFPSPHLAEPDGLLGVGGDLRDSSSDPFFYAGARMNLVTINVGLQGRVGPDGWSGGLWLGLPL